LQRTGRMDEMRATVLRAEVESRLRPVCPDWPEELFQAVVSRIVELTIKYESGGAKADLLLDPRISDDLFAEMKDAADRGAEVRDKLPSPPPLET
jgi:hypothetical protein